MRAVLLLLLLVAQGATVWAAPGSQPSLTARRLLRAPRIPDSIAFDNRNMLLPHAQDKVRRTVQALQANVGNVNRAQLLHAKTKMAEPVVRALTKTVVMEGRVKSAEKLRTMTGNRYSPSSVSFGFSSMNGFGFSSMNGVHIGGQGTEAGGRRDTQAWGKMIAAMSVDYAKQKTLEPNRHSTPKLGSEKPQATTLGAVTSALTSNNLSSG